MPKWFSCPPNWPLDYSYHWIRRTRWSGTPMYAQFFAGTWIWVDPLTLSEIPFYQVGWFQQEEPSGFPMSLIVTGDISPDWTGTYTRKYLYNGDWYYQLGSLQQYIVSNPLYPLWSLAERAYPDPYNFWSNYGGPDPSSPFGEYYPFGGCSGSAFIAAP